MAKINIEITSYIEDELALRPRDEPHARTVGMLVDSYIVDIIKDGGIPTKVAVALTPDEVGMIRKDMDMDAEPMNRKAKATTKQPRN